MSPWAASLPVRTKLAIPVIVPGKSLFGHSRNRVSYEQWWRERLDLWIAAIARQYGFRLITRDVHFRGVKNLRLLSR